MCIKDMQRTVTRTGNTQTLSAVRTSKWKQATKAWLDQDHDASPFAVARTESMAWALLHGECLRAADSGRCIVWAGLLSGQTTSSVPCYSQAIVAVAGADSGSCARQVIGRTAQQGGFIMYRHGAAR